MSLLRSFRNALFHIRKEAISSTASVTCMNTSENSNEKLALDPKDRSRKISVETSIRYIKSEAFKKAYGDTLVWELYRRNFKGQYPPDTRKTCIRNNRISTGSPCPICRDEYLVVHYKNTDLLKQFISPLGGNILPTMKTGVCQKQQKNLLVEIQKARNYGLLTFEIPHRVYNYSLYYKKQ